MKREIKFRAWDRKAEKIREVGEIKFDGTHYNIRIIVPTEFAPKNWSLRMFSEVDLMQFTGLKDKNGVEIYEGDICQTYSHDDGKLIDTVVFENGSFLFTNPKKLSVELRGFKTDYIEIIGNIYSNPSLP